MMNPCFIFWIPLGIGRSISYFISYLSTLTCFSFGSYAYLFKISRAFKIKLLTSILSLMYSGSRLTIGIMTRMIMNKIKNALLISGVRSRAIIYTRRNLNIVASLLFVEPKLELNYS